MTDAYRTLALAELPAYLATLPSVAARLGGTRSEWMAREVSDGNLNSVFLVEGPSDGVCVKQSLPHVRVDPSWKMPLDRTLFEARYLGAVSPHVGAAVPALLHLDAPMFCLVTERLRPHATLRDGLIARRRYPGMAEAIGHYVARAGVATSLLAEPFEAVMARTRLFSANTTLTRITVDLVMTDPFTGHARNRIPAGLEREAAALRADPALAEAASRLTRHFLGAPQALLHGDLHSGSVMATADDTRVIDGEFAAMGPVGFDLGLFLANLLLNRSAQPGLGPDPEPYGAWLLDQARVLWESFAAEFRGLCREAEGDGLRLVPPGPARERLCDGLLAGIEADMIGYAGLETIRRVVGFAQVRDLDAIDDPHTALACRREALSLGRALLSGRIRRIDGLAGWRAG